MKIKYNVSGKRRKDFVKAISTITGAPAKYMGAPTFNYEVDYFTIDKEGTLIFDDRADSEEIEHLLAELDARSYCILTGADSEAVGLTISLPKDSFTDEALENLNHILTAKGELIKKALGITDLPILMEDDKIAFPWFSIQPQDAEETKAYTHFIASICDMAKNQKRISGKEKIVENEKYAFRCFLLRLGFIGDEFKMERKILLKNLEGSAAFKNLKEVEK